MDCGPRAPLSHPVQSARRVRQAFRLRASKGDAVDIAVRDPEGGSVAGVYLRYCPQAPANRDRKNRGTFPP